MSIADRLRAAWRLLGEWAEAMDYSPVEELERRVSRIERWVDPDGNAPSGTGSELPLHRSSDL